MEESMLILVVIQHVVEGIVKLIRHFLDLKLFSVYFILNIVDSMIQFGDVALSILIASLGYLETIPQVVSCSHQWSPALAQHPSPCLLPFQLVQWPSCSLPLVLQVFCSSRLTFGCCR